MKLSSLKHYWLFSISIVLLCTFLYVKPPQDELFLRESLAVNFVTQINETTPITPHLHYKLIKATQYATEVPKDALKTRKLTMLTYFMILGNYGEFLQIPTVLNSIRNYTDHLNAQQDKEYYFVNGWAFDFGKQPSAYSVKMIEEQSEFVRECIEKVMGVVPNNANFTIIAHSTGSLVGYKAMSSSPIRTRLSNFISLAAPLVHFPQLITHHN